MNKNTKEYFERKISQSDGLQMISVIYEILITYLNNAFIVNTNENLLWADKCIDELIKSINFDVNPSKELLNIYTYCKSRLHKARLEENKTYILEVKYIMEKFLKTYKTIESAETDNLYTTYNSRGMLI